jgi:hypothetical protein
MVILSSENSLHSLTLCIILLFNYRIPLYFKAFTQSRYSIDQR